MNPAHSLPVDPQNAALECVRQAVVGAAVMFAFGMIIMGLGAVLAGAFVYPFGIAPGVAVEGAGARWLGFSQACCGVMFLAVAMPRRLLMVAWGLSWMALAFASTMAAIICIA